MRYSRKINSPRKSSGTHQFVTFHQSPKLHCLSTHRSTLTAQHTLTRLRPVYCEHRANLGLHPACAGIQDEELLKNPVYDGEYTPEDWALESRRNWL